jgi:hypothetical protein
LITKSLSAEDKNNASKFNKMNCWIDFRKAPLAPISLVDFGAGNQHESFFYWLSK